MQSCEHNLMIFFDDDDELFGGMVDPRKAFSLISSREYCQRSSPSRISNMPRAGLEPVQNLSSGFVEWVCAASPLHPGATKHDVR